MELPRPFQENTPEKETYDDLTHAAEIVRRAFIRVAGTSSVDNFKGLSNLMDEILSVRENQKALFRRSVKMGKFYLYGRGCGILNNGMPVQAQNKTQAKKGFVCTKCGKAGSHIIAEKEEDN